MCNVELYTLRSNVQPKPAHYSLILRFSIYKTRPRTPSLIKGWGVAWQLNIWGEYRLLIFHNSLRDSLRILKNDLVFKTQYINTMFFP